jgi:hypothetical protein
MYLDASHPANRQALQALESTEPWARPLTPSDEAHDPYYEAGCHPEVVGWMWEELAKGLPPESRCLVYGTPALVQPVSGIVLALGMGTTYCLRILPAALPEAASFGCTPVHVWGESGGATDLQVAFGEGWIFGSFGAESVRWCHASFRHFSKPPFADSVLITPETPAKEEESD